MPQLTQLPEIFWSQLFWLAVVFGITFFVLKKFAFAPIQKTIDARRDRIREAVEEADKARDEARGLLEQNRAILAEARSDYEARIAMGPPPEPDG